MHESDLYEDGTLKIGAVSRLTGLSTHTLRKWESRYGAVMPGRTEGGERVYTRADLERLSLIKRLVDAGVAPRDVARLTRADLAKKCEDLTAAEHIGGADKRPPLRTLIIGSTVLAMLDRRPLAKGVLDVVASVDTAADVVQTDGSIDLLVYECPSVGGDTRATVEKLQARVGAGAAVVVYRFGTRRDLSSLSSPQLATLRAPTDARALEQVALELTRPVGPPRPSGHKPVQLAGTDADVPAPRLSLETIARIARSSPRIRCECPHHLSEILLGLRAFEEYSKECESRSTEDAALHRYLWFSAAQARTLFEDAIEYVAAVEGIETDE